MQYSTLKTRGLPHFFFPLVPDHIPSPIPYQRKQVHPSSYITKGKRKNKRAQALMFELRQTRMCSSTEKQERASVIVVDDNSKSSTPPSMWIPELGLSTYMIVMFSFQRDGSLIPL